MGQTAPCRGRPVGPETSPMGAPLGGDVKFFFKLYSVVTYAGLGSSPKSRLLPGLARVSSKRRGKQRHVETTR